MSGATTRPRTATAARSVARSERPLEVIGKPPQYSGVTKRTSRTSGQCTAGVKPGCPTGGPGVILPSMDAVRPPAVAGSFYPADPIELRETVSRLLAAARPGPVPKAVIAPHAAYIYSGPVAASAFRRVVLLGPSHFAHVRGLALPDAAAMSTPLGNVAVEDLPLPRNGPAHQREHSLEVELPFLQVALRLETVAPLAVGDAVPEEVAGVLEQ